ncbi:hypothetical protein GJQ57_11840 [Ralstonia pickettii]|uniref:Uncharacterized protein n=1 Tax=Ralstonia pickettii TaxID=329 RepID=A0A7X2HMN8_RALPI|nr:hypothetical protein [Ralstonia pickettii]MRS99337.1 hypothetical protein [Ralstonia pickettii]
MTKLLRDLLLDLDQLNREIHCVRHKEISSDTMAVRFPRASVATRRRLQALLSAPPQRRGITASDHRAQLFEWVCNLEKAWGGVCLTPDYPVRYVPFEFECAAGHRFSMLTHGLRLGHWCQACARDRTGYPTLHDAQEIHFRTRIQTGDLLDHSTAVQYRLDDAEANVYLPEYSIGLGYWLRSSVRIRSTQTGHAKT